MNDLYEIQDAPAEAGALFLLIHRASLSSGPLASGVRMALSLPVIEFSKHLFFFVSRLFNGIKHAV